MTFPARLLLLIAATFTIAACGSDSSSPTGPSGTTSTPLGPPQLSVQVTFTQPAAEDIQGFAVGPVIQRRGVNVGLTVSNEINSLPATITDIKALVSLMPDLSSPLLDQSVPAFQPFTVGAGQTVSQSYSFRFWTEGDPYSLGNPDFNPTANFKLTLSYDYSGGVSSLDTTGTFDTAVTRRPIEDCVETEYRLCVDLSTVGLKITVWYGETEPVQDMRATVHLRYSDGGQFTIGEMEWLYVQLQDRCEADNEFDLFAQADSSHPLTLKITNMGVNLTQELLKPSEPQQVQDYFTGQCIIKF